jgi:hypothetical protein
METGWWTIQVAVCVLIAFCFILQLFVSRRPKATAESCMLWRQVVLASALAGLLSGLSATAIGLSGMMDVYGGSHAGDMPFLCFSYHYNAMPTFYGVIILVGGYLLNAIGRCVELAGRKKRPNQAPQDTARKLADPERGATAVGRGI